MIKTQATTIADNCNQMFNSINTDYLVLVACNTSIFGITPELIVSQVIPSPGSIFNSPDAKYLLHYSRGAQANDNSLITLFSATDHSPIRELHEKNIRQILWLPDSQGFLFLSLGGLYSVSPIESEPKPIYSKIMDDYRKLDIVWFAP
jgi:hypothetical protein